jgi:hypothetical protein
VPGIKVVPSPLAQQVGIFLFWFILGWAKTPVGQESLHLKLHARKPL